MKLKNTESKANGVQNQKTAKQQKNLAKANVKKEILKTPKKTKTSPRKLVPQKLNADTDEDDEEKVEGNEEDIEWEDIGEEEESSNDELNEDDDGEETHGESPKKLDEDDADDNEAPVEVPIVKFKVDKNPDAASVQKINTGNVPQDMPNDQVIFVKNLPKKFKQVDIVGVFGKYGQIHTISCVHGPHKSTAHIAFTTPEAAAASLAADKVAEVKGNKIGVSLRRVKNDKKEEKKEHKEKERNEHKKMVEESADRTVYLRHLKNGTTMEQVEEHFAKCGAIQNISLLSTHLLHFGAFVTFEKEESLPAAKKLHNSVLNESTIGVTPKNEKRMIVTDKHRSRTILVKNTENLKFIAGDRLTKIFSKCGQIENLDILCKKNVLAFITFANEAAVKEAFNLNGQTVDGLELQIEKFELRLKLSVFVKNVKQGVTETEIRELFAESGPIRDVHIMRGCAIVTFENQDSFCKSFLLHETPLHGQKIYLEPHTEKKKSFSKNAGGGGFKRKHFSAPGAHAKKFKKEF